MRPIRRILVTVKYPAAKPSPALGKAAQLARSLGASLELFHVLSTATGADADGFDGRSAYQRNTREAALAQLETLARPLRKDALPVSVAAEWDYPPFEAIIRRVQRARADLIVAEFHAGRHVAPALLQLTDWELLRNSPVPVLLVRKGGSYREPVVLAAVDPAHKFSKPAQLDAQILAAGQLVTAALDGELHAVHAFNAIPAGCVSSTYIGRSVVTQIEAEKVKTARRSFDAVLRNSGLARSHRHLLDQRPMDAIERTAHRLRADIVVMGAVSRSGLKRLFIGNTAEALLDRLTCDVLIVKPRSVKTRVSTTARGIKTGFAPAPGLPI